MKNTVINWMLDPEEKKMVDRLKKKFSSKTRLPIMRMALKEFYEKNFSFNIPTGINKRNEE